MRPASRTTSSATAIPATHRSSATGTRTARTSSASCEEEPERVSLGRCLRSHAMEGLGKPSPSFAFKVPARDTDHEAMLWSRVSRVALALMLVLMSAAALALAPHADAADAPTPSWWNGD